MVLGLGLTSESPAGIVDMQISDSVVGKGVGFSFSNSFPGDADPAGLGITCGEHVVLGTEEGGEQWVGALKRADGNWPRLLSC